ncbi:hypothetical protein ACLBWX_22525 [Methylobacterium sp. M6A4_1b]
MTSRTLVFDADLAIDSESDEPAGLRLTVHEFEVQVPHLMASVSGTEVKTRYEEMFHDNFGTAVDDQPTATSTGLPLMSRIAVSLAVGKPWLCCCKMLGKRAP